MWMYRHIFALSRVWIFVGEPGKFSCLKDSNNFVIGNVKEEEKKENIGYMAFWNILSVESIRPMCAKDFENHIALY